MENVVEVDGSYGEGGGQILRTAAAFSVALRKQIHVTKIRAGREPQGLRQQHASALEILSTISGGTLTGCRVGSSEVTLRPGRVSGGSFFFDLKTAASITLVLQAAIPAVALSGGAVNFELVGGTDVPWSPTFDYYATIVREAFSRIGLEFRVEASERGYYPKGGGRVKVSIAKGGPSPSALQLVEPSGRGAVSLVSRCGLLPERVARRQAEAAVEVLRANGIEVAGSELGAERSGSPGSSLLIYEVTARRLIGSDGLGSKGKSAERVGAEVAENFARVSSSQAAVDSNLADMLAPVLSLADGESRLRIPAPTEHLETSLHVAELFTGCNHSLNRDGPSWILNIRPRASR